MTEVTSLITRLSFRRDFEMCKAQGFDYMVCYTPFDSEKEHIRGLKEESLEKDLYDLATNYDVHTVYDLKGPFEQAQAGDPLKILPYDQTMAVAIRIAVETAGARLTDRHRRETTQGENVTPFEPKA